MHNQLIGINNVACRTLRFECYNLNGIRLVNVILNENAKHRKKNKIFARIIVYLSTTIYLFMLFLKCVR